MVKFNPFPAIENLDTNNVSLETKNNEVNELTKEGIIQKYNELVYKLYKLKMTAPSKKDDITNLEYQITTYATEYNLSNIEKIDATLFAVEKYYNEFKNEEEKETNKRRGLTIYKDLSYKLHKTKLENPSDLSKIKKLEQKIKLCKEKYQLSPIEQVDIKIEVFQKYEDLLQKREQNKKYGLNTYKDLLRELHNLKKENNNISKINDIELKLKKCSKEYNLSNIDRIDIQFQLLEEFI